MRLSIRPTVETYTFEQGAWTPATPILEIGEAAKFYVPCVTNPCVDLTLEGRRRPGGGLWSSLGVYRPAGGVDLLSRTGDCDSRGTVTNGTCPTLITRTWIATNSCGGRAEYSQTVTIRDPGRAGPLAPGQSPP
jgi:hypothetical protein